MKNSNVKINMKDTGLILKKRGMNRGGSVQQVIDSEILRLCTPYIPFQDGELTRSGIANTRLGSGSIIWDTPYARRWYYRPANFNGAPKRGNYWFERMKNEGGKQKIIRVAAAKAGLK